MKQPHRCIIRVPGEREKERNKEKIFEEIMMTTFRNMMKLQTP